MNKSTYTNSINQLIPIALFDAVIISLVYFLPSIMHLLPLPIYLIEPMRLMLILSIVHTKKYNAFILAATLPLFSFLTSGHPVFIKMIIMCFEFIANVYIFYILQDRIRSNSLAALLSILSSKLLYYIVKFGLLSIGLLSGELISTPIWLQILISLILSVYVLLFMKDRAKGKA